MTRHHLLTPIGRRELSSSTIYDPISSAEAKVKPKQRKKESKVNSSLHNGGEETHVLFSDEQVARPRFRRANATKAINNEESHVECDPVVFSDETLLGRKSKRRGDAVKSWNFRDDAEESANGRNTSPQRRRKKTPEEPKQFQEAETSNKEVGMTQRNVIPTEEQLESLKIEVEQIKDSIFQLKGPFRELQQEAILSACLGRNVCCVVPTGSGKSLIYQIPALVLGDQSRQVPGLTIVVSPLKALINDQAKYLSGVLGTARVGVIHGDMPWSIQQATLNNAGDLTFLVVTPETLISKRVQKVFREVVKPKRFVFDEAHCIYEWGGSFRPKYREVCEVVRDMFQTVPWTLLSATAPPEVRASILDIFGKDPSHVDIFVSNNIDRPNLNYQVRKKPSSLPASIRAVGELITESKLAIVYCLTKDECEQVAEELSAFLGKAVPTYHAGLSATARNAAMTSWQLRLSSVIVATSAFGMGIHVSSVRLIVHFSMPVSLSSFIQQSGRAGRDGKPATCVLFFDPKAVKIAYQLTEGNSTARSEVDEMVSFCKSTVCVRELLRAKLMGDSTDSKGLLKCQKNCSCRQELKM